ncbi:uncharacterized protein LOC123529949 [Mercenaria mercenaria]|uniref:uncharacterized protein LOC123529949 n=1 Tax=Mercenaria mercenaria TaxID=6596 RepID=UPI00234EAD12|nr:uncharacterized protein LOC123529949 [Mercenaria mercenaria]
MVKKDTFKDKPKPPNREQIIADLASVPESDVVFLQQFSDSSSLHHSKEDTSDHSDTSHGQNTGQSEPLVTDRVKINQTYEQVTKLIQLHTDLASEPKKLEEKYDHLEKLGQEVADSISELRSAAESIVKRTKK